MIAPSLTHGKTIAELDQIINQALADKQTLADAKVEKLFAYIEAETEDLHITTKQLLAAFNKWKRKARSHKDNAAIEE
jgi:hypothetical protein